MNGVNFASFSWPEETISRLAASRLSKSRDGDEGAILRDRKTKFLQFFDKLEFYVSLVYVLRLSFAMRK